MALQRTMLKFPLPDWNGRDDDGSYTVQMPPGSVVRSCAMQHGKRTLWAECTTEEGKYPPGAPSVCRSFYVLATGEVFPDGANYIGTIYDGNYVWHIAEKLT